VGRLRRHHLARLRTHLARGGAGFHSTDAAAFDRTIGSYFGAFGAGMSVVRAVDQLEVRRSQAHLGASHHEPEMERKRVYADYEGLAIAVARHSS
jgi:hypothetical protein